LLVHFHVKYICEQTTPNEILEALDGLKSSSTDDRPLDPTYNRAIETLKKQSKSPRTLAINILSWLLKARRPMTVDEIRTAARLEPGKYQLDELDLPADETLLDVCAGLVMIDKESKTIKFVHYTVQEYILNNDIITGDTESKLAELCVTYLLFKIFEVPPKTEETTLARLESHPFLHYVASHISFHVGIRENDELTEIVMKFLKRTGNVLSFLRACDNLNIVSFLENREIQIIEELEKWEALCIACRIGHHGSVKILIDDGAEVLKSDRLGRTPLYFSVHTGSTLITQLLLDVGAEISTQTLNDQRTPLIEGVRNGHLPIAQILLDNGANAGAQDQYGWTALHHAACEGYCEIVQLLINNHGVEISAQEEDGWTALHLAAHNGHLPVVQLLLDKGADVSDRNKNGASVLYIAAQMGHLPVVQLLLDKGADVSDRNKNGASVLYIAAHQGHLPVVQLLLDKGADVSDLTNDGWSVLHTAAQHGHLPVVQLLLEYGADMLVQGPGGTTALRLAKSKSMTQLLTPKANQEKRCEEVSSQRFWLGRVLTLRESSDDDRDEEEAP
jgi:ankyrin repeat protein